MGCDSAYCTCEPKLDKVPEELIDEVYLADTSPWTRASSVVAEQPEGWHACLKQKTRCRIRTLEEHGDEFYVRDFEATNSCHVEDAEVCPRVTAGSKSGEGYELCGPPNHAEQEAAKLILSVYPDGAPEGSTAFLYGHTYLCQTCQEVLVAVGVRHHVITGEDA